MRKQLSIDKEFYRWKEKNMSSERSHSDLGTYPLWKAFLKDPSVASITPSSEYLCRAITSQITDPAQNVLELGAGDGTMTRYILDALHWSASVYALETNEALINTLRSRSNQSRLKAYNTSAEDLELVCTSNNFKPGYIISGIPFRFIEKEAINSIIKQCHSVLTGEGKLLIYQTWIPGRGPYAPLKSALDKYFRIENHEIVLRNIPPLYLLTCTPREKM